MAIALIIVLAIVLYASVGRRWINTWGATEAEATSTLPGDELLSSAQSQSTRAITIHAPPTRVWQWLVQIGQGRGGFYSYDWLENLFGLDIHTVNEIVPELQHLAAGDQIRLAKQGAVYRVAILEPERTLILRMLDQKTLELADPNAPDYYEATWGFILDPIDEQTTRFIARGRGASNTFVGRVMNEVVGLISFIMETRMLRTIKARAEQTMTTG